MGIRASSTTTVAFADVQVPAENVLGEVGKGFKVAMAILNNGRTGLGGGAVGGMKTLIKLATAQAKERKQFGKPDRRLRPGAREDRADDGRLLRRRERGVDGRALHRLGLRRLLGRGGDQQGVRQRGDPARRPRGPADRRRQRLHARVPLRADRARRRILSIFEGTNEILRLYIALSGLKDVGAIAGRTEVRDRRHLQQPDQGLRRALGLCQPPRCAKPPAVGTDKILRELHPAPAQGGGDLREVRRRTVQGRRCAAAQARQEASPTSSTQQKRLADLAIDLFVGCCTLSRVDMLVRENDPEAESALDIAEMFTRQARRRMSRNVRCNGAQRGRPDRSHCRQAHRRGPVSLGRCLICGMAGRSALSTRATWAIPVCSRSSRWR